MLDADLTFCCNRLALRRELNGAHWRLSERLELIEGEDYYWEGAVMVFTARFHLKRGRCCGNRCRHCPYGNSVQQGGTMRGAEGLPEPNQSPSEST